jgi:hypothetical protein
MQEEVYKTRKLLRTICILTFIIGFIIICVIPDEGVGWNILFWVTNVLMALGIFGLIITRKSMM